MICPYCGDDMEKGVIQSPYQIFWAPGDKRHGAGNANFHEGSIVLSELSIFKGLRWRPMSAEAAENW